MCETLHFLNKIEHELSLLDHDDPIAYFELLKYVDFADQQLQTRGELTTALTFDLRTRISTLRTELSSKIEAILDRRLIAQANLALKRKEENELGVDSMEPIEPVESIDLEPKIRQISRGEKIDQPLFQKKHQMKKSSENDAIVETNLITEMAELASRMKESTLAIQSRLSSDITHLEVTAETIEKNISSISSVSEKLAQSNKNDILGLCATFGLLSLSVLIFVIAYLSIKILPAPHE
jgi:hypothetical protein